ncbi:MAG: GGDEF domain-containing protein [Lachnospiraceae bacterium]|nr:GGDEF domain-containing protein [Lachnospiraceae bacterium]
MYYSIIGMISFSLLLILNHKFLIKSDNTTASKAVLRYKNFLISVLGFCACDILWGLFAAYNMPKLLYVDTIIYFVAMTFSVLVWVHYVISYLDPRNRVGRVLVVAGNIVFGFEIIALIFNFFNPILFYLDNEVQYIPGMARYLTIGALFVMFLLTSIHAFDIASKTSGKERVHNRAVAFSGIFLTLFTFLQIVSPLYPCYCIGCLVATTLIHVFVEEDERKIFNKERETYNHIAASLAEEFDAIYYIDIESGRYREFSHSDQYGSMDVPTKGEDFYSETLENIRKFVHPEDQEFAETLFQKDAMLKALEDQKSCSYKYRLMINGKPRYYSFTVFRTDDNTHLVVCDKDVHAEMTAEKARLKKQKDSLKALRTEKELARRDELTGVKNKTAYTELVSSVQHNIDNGIDYLTFALVVCDINNLKEVNDLEGHRAGDEYIKECCTFICRIFAHSPVFRIGGDEFVVFLRGNDFSIKEELVEQFKKEIAYNAKTKGGPVVAIGMSTYLPESDMSVSDIFERADNLMYENKRSLKAIQYQ